MATLSRSAPFVFFAKGIKTYTYKTEEMLNFSHKGYNKKQGSERVPLIKKINIDRMKNYSIATICATALTENTILLLLYYKGFLYYEILSYHHMKHQNQLSSQKLNIKKLLRLLIRLRNLNYREFEAFLIKVGS